MLCPTCNYESLVPVWYGDPTLREILLAQQDKIALGGPYEKSYSHFCTQCQNTYPLSED